MIQIHDHGKIIEVEPSDKSQLTRGIMRSSELLLSFRSDVALDIHVGATVDFEGETFTLIYPSELRKLRRGYYDYTVTMHSSAELLKQRLLKDPSDPGRTAFTFTGSAHDFATLVARSMGEGWSVGDCMVSDGDRMIAFREETCLGALARIAEDFHSEWVVERQTIAIRKQELWRDDPVAMSYGRGKGFLSGVSRSGDGDKLPISRLYVVGGSRNIDPTAYGSRSLHLPDGSTSLSSGVEGREAALDLSHIYPSRVGTVSEVVTVSEEKCFYDIKDDSVPAELNYSDCRIPGEKAVIRFQSGALAGRELEIRQSETALEGYHHEERRFELVPREEDGFTFPSAQWMPKAGDKYAVFGISLPPTYVKEAEERMLSEAKRYLEDNKEPVYTFRGEVDGIWARAHWLEVGGKLVPGGHVLFSDPEFHPKGTVIRIVSTTQAVNDPHAPSVTLSTAPVPGSILSRLDRVEADEVVRREQIREVQRQQSQSYRQALEHLSMVDRAVEGLEGFTRRLKPSVLETMGILVGSQATQLDFVRAVGSIESVTPAINYDPDTKALHIAASVIRHQTIGITTMRDRRDPSEYRYWRLPEYVSPPLTDPDRSYYIYARAARVGTEGTFLLSEEPIPMESDPDYFHLLIGTLSSIDGGDRAYNRLYGFSMISPGQMVVDTISSANGRMTIDLAQGAIYASSVSFSRPDGARGSLSDLAGEVDELQSHPPMIVDGKWHVWDGKAQTYVNTGDDARGENGKNGLSPKILDGKWSVWDGSRWVSTGVPAQGPKGEQGEQGEKGEQGAPGKDVDPKVLNDLKTAVDDARRKLDDTVSKAELDGVVSAQEQKDIKAAKAALDAAKKAYDDAVQKAKELDDEIQVGGRNLLRGTDYSGIDRLDTRYWSQDFHIQHDDTYAYVAYGYNWDYLYKSVHLEPGTYTLSVTAKSHEPGKPGKLRVDTEFWEYGKTFGVTTDEWQRYSLTFDITEPYDGILRLMEAGDLKALIRFAQIKLERGIVSTDWTPAPEDVQAEIYAAKEQADKAQTSTDKLRGYVDGAYKDGIITEVESKAIATYINEVEAMWSSAFGAFERVYVNSLLTGTPKTALGDAKITLAGAKDNLIGQIKQAISDGKATKAEATETERLYNVYKGALRDFQKALKSAEEAIRDAGMTTGGRNLLRGTDYSVIDRLDTRYWSQDFHIQHDDTYAYVAYGYNWDYLYKSVHLEPGTYTLSVTAKSHEPGKPGKLRVDTEFWEYGKTFGVTTDEWQRYSLTFDITEPYDGILRLMEAGDLKALIRFAQIKLERGIVSTDWTPAPEDVQAEIDAERAAREAAVREVATGLANTDTLVSALEKAQSKLDQGILTKADTKDIQYLLDSLKNGDTQVAGGLVLSNDIILSDPNSRDVTATISGTQTQGANVMRLGISYTCDEDKKATVERAGAKWGINLSSVLTGLESDSDRIRKLDELGFTIVGGRSLGWPKWEICKATDAKEGGEATALANDGTGHIGELYFWGESIGFGATDKRYMQIGGTARSEYDMVNASTVIRKFGISGGTVRKSGTFVLDRFDSRYSNREIKYTANLSAWAEARAYRVPDNGGWDPNDHRYHKPEYEEFVRTESSATVQLRLELTRGGSTIKTVTSPQVSVSVSAQGGQFGINEEIPQSALYAEDRKSQNVTITISPSDVREQDTVTLSLVTTIRRYCYHHQGSEEIDRYASATASAGSIINFLPYDTSQPMVSVTKDRAAFFYGRSKYVLLNYLESYVMKVVGNILLQGNLILKGDLTAEYADFPGVPLCGGMVTEKGTFKKSFGRYKNQSGRNIPRVSYDYSSKVYTVYHSIGNDNYIPSLTVYGPDGMSRCLCIMSVDSYSFKVKAYNSGDWGETTAGFSYVCFKA